MSAQHEGTYLGRAIADEVAGKTAVLALDTAADSTSIGAISDVVTLLVTVGASDLGLLNHLGLLRTGLHGVADFLAVTAVGLHVVHRETGVLETLKVLLRGLRPTL